MNAIVLFQINNKADLILMLKDLIELVNSDGFDEKFTLATGGGIHRFEGRELQLSFTDKVNFEMLKELYQPQDL